MATRDAGDGVVEFPDGQRIRGRGLRRGPMAGPDPEFGVYLVGREPQVRWPSHWVRWRDFGLPHDTVDAMSALQEAHVRSTTERVEIGCGGGVGRTGTAMAVLAVLSGAEPDEAVAWVREHYHRRAVETRRQRRWIAEVSSILHR